MLYETYGKIKMRSNAVNGKMQRSDIWKGSEKDEDEE